MHEDFSQGYRDKITKTDRLVAAELAEASVQLERLETSFFVSAKHFFRACQPEWVWWRLYSLSLTSWLLMSPDNTPEINALLTAAGGTALRMPRLRLMEIWGADTGVASVFRYRTAADSTAITWRGTWLPVLAPQVVAAWRKVATEHVHTHVRHELEVRYEMVEAADEIASHLDAIAYLRLHSKVIDQTTLDLRRTIRAYAADSDRVDS